MTTKTKRELLCAAERATYGAQVALIDAARALAGDEAAALLHLELGALGLELRQAVMQIQSIRIRLGAVEQLQELKSPNGGFVLCLRCTHALTPTEEARGDALCDGCGSFGAAEVTP